jgi:hypothetical protein
MVKDEKLLLLSNKTALYEQTESAVRPKTIVMSRRTAADGCVFIS